MINYIMFVVMCIFYGQLSNLELAAASLDTNIGVQAYFGQLSNLELTAASLDTNIGVQAYTYSLLVCTMYDLITQILAYAVPLGVEHHSAQCMDPGGRLWAVPAAQLG
jgi:hypothetical protein